MEVKIMAPEFAKEKERESIPYNTACLKKKKIAPKLSSFKLLVLSRLLPHISKCSEYIPNSYCQVKMKTFSV